MNKVIASKGSACRGCGLYIKWIKTAKGKDMPVDPTLVTLMTEKGKVVRGYVPHWATCSKAGDFRK